jgi:hypothetical protein
MAGGGMMDDDSTTTSNPDVIEQALLELGLFQIPHDPPEYGWRRWLEGDDWNPSTWVA